MPVLYDQPGTLYDQPYLTYDGVYIAPGVADAIECWVTDPAGVYIAHLERSKASAFRRFAFSVERNAPGAGSLEYATPNALLDDEPTLFDEGNLVWMRYRSRTVTWIIEQITRRLAGEETDWVQVSGRGALQLLGDRLVWPDGFSEDDLDPSVWSGPGVLATTLTRAADEGDTRIVVADADRWRPGQKVVVTGGAGSDTSHIRRMVLRDDGDWALWLKDALTHDYSVGDDVVRQVPAFVATTLSASVTAGKRRIHVETAKRLHPGARLLIESGIVGERVIVREVEHVKAKGSDTASIAVAASAGAHSVTISGNHFRVGETVTVAGGGNSEAHVVEDRTKVSDSPLRWRLRLATDLADSFTTSHSVTRDAVDEDWTVTLRRPLQNGYPSGADVSRPSDQWHTVVATPVGEMLEELITDSNPRFATQVVIGTIETDPDDADQWTQRQRFDTFLDIVKAVTDAYGDVQMRGTTFDYLLSIGSDVSSTVILEEGADILRVERDVDHREAVTWVLAEGVGEGVRAKLAVSADDTATRRREGYLDAHDATNLPMLEALADAALAQNGPRDALVLDLAETRFRAFVDYDLGDTIRAIAPSRSIDETMRIVALYVAETNDETVRVSVDVNSARTEWLLELERGEQASRRTLGVHGRQPQGQLVPFTFSGSGVFDSDEAMETFLHLPDRAFLVAEALVKIQLRRFWATARSAAGGGSATQSSGSSSASTTATDGGSAQTSGTKAATTPTSTGTLESTDHYHSVFTSPGAANGHTPRGYIFTPGGHTIDLLTDGANPIDTATTPVPHTHDVTIAAHSHTVDIPNHAHGIAHTHTFDASHTHGLVYGTYAEMLPASWAVKVYVDQLDGSTWTTIYTSATVADPDKFVELDLTSVITEPGSWRIRVKSNAGQPQNGRLSADVWGVVLAGLEST